MPQRTAWGTVDELAVDAGVAYEVARGWVRGGGAPGTIKGSFGFLMPRENWDELAAALHRHATS